MSSALGVYSCFPLHPVFLLPAYYIISDLTTLPCSHVHPKLTHTQTQFPLSFQFLLLCISAQLSLIYSKFGLCLCVFWSKMLLEVQERLFQIYRAATHPRQGRDFQKHTGFYMDSMPRQQFGSLNDISCQFSVFFNLDHFIGMARIRFSLVEKLLKKHLKVLGILKTLH